MSDVDKIRPPNVSQESQDLSHLFLCAFVSEGKEH